MVLYSGMEKYVVPSSGNTTQLGTGSGRFLWFISYQSSQGG